MGNVKEDIKRLLAEKPLTERLTVALDVTIDEVNSPHIQELLEEYCNDIKDGKLNFVFFESGQKFDMLGVDHFYGGVFWMVNNGGEQWRAFDKLKTSPAHETDPFTNQWFCLSNQCAAAQLDAYRTQIFNK